jgi:YggT family protein
MTAALIFIVRTLFELYILTYAFRLVLPRSRGARFNPLVQFVQRVTNPVVLPLRRFVPALGRIDTATLVALLLLEGLLIALLYRLACGALPGPVPLVTGTLLGLAGLFLSVLFWSLLVYALLSFVSQGGPNALGELLGAIVEPVLRPVRQILPPIGGLDLSPLLVMIGIQAIRMVLPLQAGAGLGCASPLVPVI